MITQPDLDLIDQKLLAELQANARVSFAELSRKVALSTPAVIERVKRLEESGVIVGYHAQVNPSAVGRSLEAFVKVSVAGDKLLKLAQTVKNIDEVLECYRITGCRVFSGSRSGPRYGTSAGSDRPDDALRGNQYIDRFGRTGSLESDRTGPPYEGQQKMEKDRFDSVALPLYAILAPGEQIKASFPGLTRDPKEFLQFLSANERP